MARKTYACQHPQCATLPPFTTVTDHLVHVSTVHPPTVKARDEMLRRAVSCWQCAHQFLPTVAEPVCPACGFQFPPHCQA